MCWTSVWWGGKYGQNTERVVGFDEKSVIEFLCLLPCSQLDPLPSNAKSYEMHWTWFFNFSSLSNFHQSDSLYFDRIQKDIGDLPTLGLRTLCPKWWTVRHASINNVLLNYKVLQETLDEVQKGRYDYAAKARGISSWMEIFFGLKLAYLRNFCDFRTAFN